MGLLGKPTILGNPPYTVNLKKTHAGSAVTLSVFSFPLFNGDMSKQPPFRPNVGKSPPPPTFHSPKKSKKCTQNTRFPLLFSISMFPVFESYAIFAHCSLQRFPGTVSLPFGVFTWSVWICTCSWMVHRWSVLVVAGVI